MHNIDSKETVPDEVPDLSPPDRIPPEKPREIPPEQW